jgi:hypothetical protein
MKRTCVLLFAIFLFALKLTAQEPALAQPPEKQAIPVVRFIFDWRIQNPPRYSIAVDSAGRATYKSEPAVDPNGGSAPEPYLVEWTAAEPTRAKIFDSAKKLNFFDGNFESKAKVAVTGLKTLMYKDLSRDNSTSYNYSTNPTVAELTHLFQSIATTAEMGRKLAHDVRFDKLGVDADLKALQEQQKHGDALEIEAIASTLQKIANDSSMFRMSQQRAKQILRGAGLSDAPPTVGEMQQ